MARPERILLLRSGRHLQVALAALRQHSPGCDLGVVGTAGSERAIAQAGIPLARTWIYSKSPRLTPAAFLFSATAFAVRGMRFDRVAVLWNDPDGRGLGNVNRTALALAPGRFLAVTPGGQVIERTWYPQVPHELVRAVISVATAVILAALYLPAMLLPPKRR